VEFCDCAGIKPCARSDSRKRSSRTTLPAFSRVRASARVLARFDIAGAQGNFSRIKVFISFPARVYGKEGARENFPSSSLYVCLCVIYRERERERERGREKERGEEKEKTMAYSVQCTVYLVFPSLARSGTSSSSPPRKSSGDYNRGYCENLRADFHPCTLTRRGSCGKLVSATWNDFSRRAGNSSLLACALRERY